jgi:hypothetical protein
MALIAGRSIPAAHLRHSGAVKLPGSPEVGGRGHDKNPRKPDRAWRKNPAYSAIDSDSPQA